MMKNITEIHKAFTDANDLFEYLSKEEITFSDKEVKDQMLIILAERINVLSWILNS